MDLGATVGIPPGIQWWEPGSLIYCKLVNRGNTSAKIQCGHPVARMIAVNTRDPERFRSLFDPSPSTVDPSSPPTQELHAEPSVDERVNVQKANCGKLSLQQNHHLENLFDHFIVKKGFFPQTPNGFLLASTANSPSPSRTRHAPQPQISNAASPWRKYR